jgi:membrane protein implicated in regulation of membrane protease activity
MIGTRGVVCDPIRNGVGKVRLGDGVWLAEGPEMAQGTPIVVIAVRGARVSVALPKVSSQAGTK